ncbi:MAG: BlaI/MecI/CopY family transcriptional regulator [Aureliella sp.]
MVRRKSALPTELELLILKTLWAESPLPVREIRKQLSIQGREVAHTTVITTLNIMLEKGYVSRTPHKNSYLFSPEVREEDISQGVVKDVVKRVFDGSAKGLMLSLLASEDVSDEELDAIREMIDRKTKG